MYRLFVAIDLPETVLDLLDRISRLIPGVRWLDRDQVHLTLRFIGEADEDHYWDIRRLLEGICERPFQIRLQGVGCFPPRRDPRVLWAGVLGGDTLGRLQEKVELAVASAGFLPDDRPFAAHVTLARLRDVSLFRVNGFLNENVAFCSEPFPVTGFHLYSSTLTSRGAMYRREASYPLCEP